VKHGNICVKHPELNGLRHNGGNCPECSKAAHKKYREVNKEKIAVDRAAARLKNQEAIRQRQADWRANNQEQVRQNNLRRTGFTLSLFNETLELQRYRCAICHTDLKQLPRKQVHADHCHTTGAPRGVLCHYCNIALGAFRDNPELLRRAAVYLNEPPLNIA
jgi:uncharacterized protein with PIN domain